LGFAPTIKLAAQPDQIGDGRFSSRRTAIRGFHLPQLYRTPFDHSRILAEGTRFIDTLPSAKALGYFHPP
jgi:hypothetical protein